tara:strand:- start:4471 stop:5184 length:714 start_codon:yes stop_codon:yes gene_type:complete
MAQLNASKAGRLAITGQSSHAAVRDGTTANGVSVDPTFSTSVAIRYSVQAGRSGNSFQIYRTFYYFDTSGITGDVTNSTLNILGVSSNTGQFIVVPSTAFGGDGSADIVNTDYNNITFNTTLTAGQSGWSKTGNNAIAFRSNGSASGPANTAIRDNDAFIVAVIEYEHDFSDSEPGSVPTAKSNGINYATAAYLDYDEAGAASGPANLTSYNGIAKASITSINGIAIANVTTLNGIS